MTLRGTIPTDQDLKWVDVSWATHNRKKQKALVSAVAGIPMDIPPPENVPFDALSYAQGANGNTANPFGQKGNVNYVGNFNRNPTNNFGNNNNFGGNNQGTNNFRARWQNGNPGQFGRRPPFNNRGNFANNAKPANSNAGQQPKRSAAPDKFPDRRDFCYYHRRFGHEAKNCRSNECTWPKGVPPHDLPNAGPKNTQ